MLREGTLVKWKWGKGTAVGKVKEIFERTISITSKGTKVTRKGTAENKALYIQQEDGTELLKLESEVEPEN